MLRQLLTKCCANLHARGVSNGPAQIIDLARVRAARAQAGRNRRAIRSPRFVIATSLAIGLTLGVLAVGTTSDSALTLNRNGMLLADGGLARALNEQLTGGAPLASSIRISGTYRSRLGNVCRSFSIAGAQPVTGIACRIRAQWQLQTLLNGSAPPATLAELNRNIVGAALASATESQLRAHDWK
jgi:hypothetical protein